MALKKADYIAQGREDGSTGAPRREGFTKNSWQENAYDLGYNEAYKEYVSRGNAMAADLENEAHARSLETVGTTEVVELRVPVAVAEAIKANPKGAEDALGKYGVPHAVIEHINYLHRQRATCTDEKRRLRLLDKAIALKNKWSKRSFAAYDRFVRA